MKYAKLDAGYDALVDEIEAVISGVSGKHRAARVSENLPTDVALVGDYAAQDASIVIVVNSHGVVISQNSAAQGYIGRSGPGRCRHS